MDINPDCVKRTAEALAEGHEMAQELERKILEMRHEREVQMGELNVNLMTLGKDVALLTQSVAGLVNSQKTSHEEIAEVRAIAISSEKRLTAMETWRVEEGKRRDDEEKQRKENVKPLKETMWGVIQWAVIFILGVIATAVWQQYFK